MHCESSISLSLFLAGLLLKLSLFGILRFVIISFCCLFRFLCSFIYVFSFISLFIVCFSYFRFFDCKKIIAFSSILHLNLSLIAIFSLNWGGILSGIVISISHGLCSIKLFSVVGFINIRTYCRYLDSCYFVGFGLRSLLLFMLLCNLSFPLSFNFFAELLTLVSVISVDVYFGSLFLLSNYISTLFWFLVVNRKVSGCGVKVSVGDVVF